MSRKTARILAGTYFVLMAIAVTWPGLVPFARVDPLVLGLPFSMAWIAAWIAGSVLVLVLLDLVEKRHRDETKPVGPTESAGPGRSVDAPEVRGGETHGTRGDG